MDLATFWATFSKTHLVTLSRTFMLWSIYIQVEERGLWGRVSRLGEFSPNLRAVFENYRSSPKFMATFYPQKKLCRNFDYLVCVFFKLQNSQHFGQFFSTVQIMHYFFS
jgi:hypothetical protein